MEIFVPNLELPVGSDFTSTTQDITPVRFTSLSLRLIDMPGQQPFGEFNYTPEILGKIIIGEIAIPTRRIKCPRIHCYLQLIPHSIIDDDAWCGIIAENLKVVKGLGLQTVLVVTRYDEIKEQLSLDPYNNALEKEMKAQRKKFSSTFGVPFEYVRFVISYTGVHTQLNFNIDKNIYETLILAMDLARNQIIMSGSNEDGYGEIVIN